MFKLLNNGNITLNFSYYKTFKPEKIFKKLLSVIYAMYEYFQYRLFFYISLFCLFVDEKIILKNL